MNVRRKLRRKTLTKSEVLYLVEERYGSTTDFSQVIQSYGQISRHNSIAASTIHEVIVKFHRNGNRYRKMRGGMGRPSLIPRDIEERLVCE